VALECDSPKAGRAVASAKTVAAVERLAKADRRLAATADQWDTCAWSLQDDCMTIDLRTGIARESVATDYITKKAACAAAPNGTLHSLWTAFLDRITARDGELQKFCEPYW